MLFGVLFFTLTPNIQWSFPCKIHIIHIMIHVIMQTVFLKATLIQEQWMFGCVGVGVMASSWGQQKTVSGRVLVKEEPQTVSIFQPSATGHWASSPWQHDIHNTSQELFSWGGLALARLHTASFSHMTEFQTLWFKNLFVWRVSKSSEAPVFYFYWVNHRKSVPIHIIVF